MVPPHAGRPTSKRNTRTAPSLKRTKSVKHPCNPRCCRPPLLRVLCYRVRTDALQRFQRSAGVGTIQWTIPEGDLEDAVKCVTTLVEDVNRKTEEVTARAQAAMQKHQAEHQAHQERIDELQRRLDDM